MAQDSVNNHIDWLLNLANSIKSKFFDDSIETTIRKYLDEFIAENSSIYVKIITNSSLNQNAPILIISSDIPKIFYYIIDKLKDNLPPEDKYKFKPLTIITKLKDKEFIFDISGNQIIYGINANYCDENLIKSMLCRNLYSIKNYFNQINPNTNEFLTESIMDIIGGKFKKKYKKDPNIVLTKRVNIKVKILNKFIDYAKSNSTFMESLIYLNSIEDIDNHAMDIIYSDNRAKDAVIDYLKILVKTMYGNEYKFEYNPHINYSIPFDFRLKKLSCFIKHRKTNQNIYLINLYNVATYDPVPCYRLIDDKNNCQLIAHPLVQLRFLYLDKYFLTIKNEDSLYKLSQFNLILDDMINTIHNKLKKNEMPLWAGSYRDENYDKNQDNMRTHIDVPYEIILI